MLIDTLLACIPLIQAQNKVLEGSDMAPILFAMQNALRFKVDNVASYIHGYNGKLDANGNKHFVLEKVLPNIAPVAGFMWFEYGGFAVGQSIGNMFGCLVTIHYDREADFRAAMFEGKDIPDKVRWVLRTEDFSYIHEEVGTSEHVYYYFVGDEGNCIGVVERMNYRWLPDDYVSEHNLRGNSEEAVTALASLCFCHCNGTRIIEQNPTRQVRRAAERARRPIFRYYTLDIYPVTEVLRITGTIEKNGLPRALHICRGHFAHYTSEHPLFGKYTGTFYKPMHVRGKAEYGIVGKDYRVYSP